jgi:Mitochondrial carrier protein
VHADAQRSFSTLHVLFFMCRWAWRAQRRRNVAHRPLIARTYNTHIQIAHTVFFAQVCMVRMQADGRLPAAERRGYANVADALARVAREEGVLTYWRGASPTGERKTAYPAYHCLCAILQYL